jgi:hypothetical protein
MKALVSIITNPLLYLPFYAWFIAQTLKLIQVLVKEKKVSLRIFLKTGGMPSAHTAFVTCLTTLIGFREGWSSSIFVVTLVFSIVVMADAAGFRKITETQIDALEKVIRDIQSARGIQNEDIKILLGHTPIEVFIGLVIGTTIAILFH